MEVLGCAFSEGFLNPYSGQLGVPSCQVGGLGSQGPLYGIFGAQVSSGSGTPAARCQRVWAIRRIPTRTCQIYLKAPVRQPQPLHSAWDLGTAPTHLTAGQYL